MYPFIYFYCLFYFTNVLLHFYKTLCSTPDVYLDKLQLELMEKHGIKVVISTIWRTLVKHGYSMKMVHSESNQPSTLDSDRNSALLHGTRMKHRDTICVCNSYRNI